ncbi:hypothetical protein DT73_17180 [Mangrovibacter sp. MFB070]|uniref:hypothetical protein n=1 Tax=Mangrovibacter sp. MFB070 TaxID=1224318 RepID=UPI0004D49238|nr:hypothetical protein [Mangrovibacter sp. MFB070]KEA51447.1 hypothetical protein DT73_17180 [Mangrovibacter sp. MFB070]
MDVSDEKLSELRALFSPESELCHNKCKELSKEYDSSLSLEKETVSEYSPGIISNEEYVCRQVFSPIHYDSDTGEIKSAAFDDVTNKGLSVNRLSCLDEAGIHQLGITKAENDNVRKGNSERVYLGFAKSNVNEIRRIIDKFEDSDKEKRIFAVYDSSLADVPSHADICQIEHNQCSSSLGKKATNMLRRARLQEKFCDFIKIQKE